MTEDAADTCPICGRPLGSRRERHHLIPKSEGGRETVNVHPICHRTIHATFSERDLAERYATPEALRAHPAMTKFIRWVSKRPPDFHKRTNSKR